MKMAGPANIMPAFIAQDGKLKKGGLSQAFISKTALPDYREFDDSRYFHSLAKLLPHLPGKTLEDLIQPVSVTIRGKEVKLGVFICEDGWTENYDFNVPQILTKNGGTASYQYFLFALYPTEKPQTRGAL